MKPQKHFAENYRRTQRNVALMGKTLRERQAETGRTLALDGAAWRKLRASVLREVPLCEYCQAAPASEVDHLDNDPTNNERSNLVSACKPCHSRKTQEDQGKRAAWGCDEKGMPLDPRHPWNLEKSPATDSHQPPGKSSVFANRGNAE